MNKKSIVVKAVQAYNDNRLNNIEFCSVIEKLFPDTWKQVVLKLMDLVDDWCPELQEVSYTDIVMWRLAVQSVVKYMESDGCVPLNRAEITSCSIHMAKHFNVDPWYVLSSTIVEKLASSAKYDSFTCLDTVEVWKDFSFPGIHKYYRNGHHESVSKGEFLNTVIIPDELAGMMSHLFHRDTYCDEKRGTWRIQGSICGRYFRMYEDSLRELVKGVLVSNLDTPSASTTRKIRYNEWDRLLVTFALPCKE